MSNRIDYKVIRSAIIKSCKGKKEGIEFKVDYDKLTKNLDEICLVPVNVGLVSRPIHDFDIPFISEHFKAQRLSWINQHKEITTLVFVTKEALEESEELQSWINMMNGNVVDDPDLDKVKVVADIIAKYPCYLSTVVSYLSNDPRRSHGPSYEIVCRQNTVSIKKDEYEYNAADMVHPDK